MYDNDFKFASNYQNDMLGSMSTNKISTGKTGTHRQRSACPISSFLDILGDKWTLLVIRDLFIGLSQFGDLQNSPEKIPTNILSERLKRLVQAGIVEKVQYQDRPVRYHYLLTEKGKNLWPVIREMMGWSHQYLGNTLSAEAIKQVASQRLASSKSR